MPLRHNTYLNTPNTSYFRTNGTYIKIGGKIDRINWKVNMFNINAVARRVIYLDGRKDYRPAQARAKAKWYLIDVAKKLVIVIFKRLWGGVLRILHDITWHYIALHYITVKYSIVQCSTVQYSTVQYSTVQYSTVQYSTVQYGTVQAPLIV